MKKYPEISVLYFLGTRVYWIHHYSLESSDLFGQNRRTLLEEGNRGLWGMFWHNGNIYMTNVKTRNITMLHEESTTITEIGGPPERPHHVIIVSSLLGEECERIKYLILRGSNHRRKEPVPFWGGGGGGAHTQFCRVCPNPFKT